MKFFHFLYIGLILLLILQILLKERQINAMQQKHQAELFQKDQQIQAIKEANPLSYKGVVQVGNQNAWVGISNHIKAYMTNIPTDQTTVSVRGGEIQKGSEFDDYNLQVSSPGTVMVNLTGRDSLGNIHENEVELRAKYFPDPSLTLGTIGGSNFMGKNEFRAQRRILAELYNMDIDLRFNVLSFDLTFARPNQEFITVSNKGATWNPETAKIVKQAESGDLYVFNNVRVMGPSRKERTLPALACQIR